MLRVIVNLCLIKMLHNSIMPKRRMKRRGGQIPSQPMNNASPSVAPKPPPNPVAVTNAYPAKPIENSMNVGGISDNQSTTSSFKSFIENYGEYIILVIIILIVGAVTSIACQIGDLFFSYLKRKAKIKDSGNFLPGHGGILDRLDGIFFGIPIGLIAITFLYK
mgnify:CR=1 FL=1